MDGIQSGARVTTPEPRLPEHRLEVLEGHTTPSVYAVFCGRHVTLWTWPTTLTPRPPPQVMKKDHSLLLLLSRRLWEFPLSSCLSPLSEFCISGFPHRREVCPVPFLSELPSVDRSVVHPPPRSTTGSLPPPSSSTRTLLRTRTPT